MSSSLREALPVKAHGGWCGLNSESRLKEYLAYRPTWHPWGIGFAVEISLLMAFATQQGDA